MTTEIKFTEGQVWPSEITYGGNEDAIEEETGTSFEQIQWEVNNAEYNIIVMGDLSERVENLKGKIEEYIGKAGEKVWINNGDRIIKLSRENCDNEYIIQA